MGLADIEALSMVDIPEWHASAHHLHEESALGRNQGLTRVVVMVSYL